MPRNGFSGSAPQQVYHTGTPWCTRSGFAALRAEHFGLDRDAALYRLDTLTVKHSAMQTGDSAALQQARRMQPACARPNTGGRYLDLRSSWRDTFDVLYLSSALTVIANLDDSSSYTGIDNLEIRARLWLLRSSL